jgi:hypothetical protein
MRKNSVQLKKEKKRNPTTPINRGNLSYINKPANHANPVQRQNKKK